MQQPHEDEQILTEHMMIVQAAARALIAARRAAQRHTQQAEARAARLAQEATRSYQRAQTEQAKTQQAQNTTNRERAQRNKDVTQQHEREVLIARWAAAEAAREQANAAAEAWSERMREAGIDPDQVKAAAAEIEAAEPRTENSAEVAAAADREATEQVQDVVVEQLAEKFVEQQLVDAGVVDAEVVDAEVVDADVVDADVVAEPGAAPEPQRGPSLVERLRGTVQDSALDSPTAGWDDAEKKFTQLVDAGADPESLVHAVGACATGRGASILMENAARRDQDKSEVNRLIAATEVNRGTSTPDPAQTPKPQPAHATEMSREASAEVGL